VIDIGCGGGGTTIAIGRAVSPGGSATGVDISADLIWHASTRATQGTQSDVRFCCADAATATITGGPFDRLFSRFGSMFFPDAPAGFRNLRRMLKEGGRIDLAVWAPPFENPWMMAIMGVVAKHIGPPQTDPRAPGPFALADTGYARDLLDQGRFESIEITPCETLMPVGGAGATPAEAAQFIAGSLSVARSLEAAPEALREAVIADLAAALEPHHVPGKGNLLGGKAWLVTARAA
jgi:ubiquinone/menaquinone biosynthesis C-methylase UbiE